MKKNKAKLKIENLKKFRKLDFDLYKFLIEKFGKRGDKAFFYVKEGRVKKYKDFFIVVGKEEYIVDEDFCTCKDFQIKLKGKKPCAHILAVGIAKNLRMYDEINGYYIDFIKMKRGRWKW